jgi:hypothetical protein
MAPGPLTLSQLDDTALLMQRQEAADKGDRPRKLELDAEVIRRWGHGNGRKRPAQGDRKTGLEKLTNEQEDCQ